MKIFGIGLPRTGTTSLNTALEILGFCSLHFPHDPMTIAELRAGNYRLSILNQYDALTDIPVPAIFAQLDELYPGSKFILTVRDMDNWLDSCKSAWFNQSDAVPEPGSAREFYRTLLYGCNNFNRDRFRWVYETHLKLVHDHFSGDKSKQMLILDVISGDGWHKLCPFLGVDIPNTPFPHKNKRFSDQPQQAGLVTSSRLSRKILGRFFGRYSPSLALMSLEREIAAICNNIDFFQSGI
jgi:hypothetical protein